MNEGKGPATGDREHLERYLKWRAEFRRRAARRRRWFCSVAVVSLAAIGVALVTWRTELTRDALVRIAFERRQAPPKSVATTSHDSEPRPPLSAPPAGTVVERTPAERSSRVAARETPRIGPPERSSGASKARTLPPRQPSSLPSPVADGPARTPDVAAGLRVADASRAPDAAVSPPPPPISTFATPATVLTSPLLREKVAERSEAVSTVTPTNPTPDDPQTVTPPPSKPEAVTTAIAPPSIPDAGPGPGCSGASVTEAGQSRGGHGQPRHQAVADCVVGWLKGEVQEFRDGANREIGEFRAGFDRVRRALQWFGSKVRSSE